MCEQKCPCGQPLPHHLAECGLTDHVCSCERSFKVEGKTFVENGTEVNPFARYDAAHEKKARKRR